MDIAHGAITKEHAQEQRRSYTELLGNPNACGDVMKERPAGQELGIQQQQQQQQPKQQQQQPKQPQQQQDEQPKQPQPKQEQEKQQQQPVQATTQPSEARPASGKEAPPAFTLRQTLAKVCVCYGPVVFCSSCTFISQSCRCKEGACE